MENDLFAAIAKYQEDVFEYRPAEMAVSFLTMVKCLDYWVNQVFREEHRIVLNDLLHTMLTAYENKDYLLVADFAEYELKPLALDAMEGGDGNAVC